MFENMTIRLVTAVISFFAVAGFIAAQAIWQNNVSRDIDAIRMSLLSLEALEINERLKFLESQYANRWTRYDQILWKFETEKLNKGTWKGKDIRPTD